MVRRPKQAKASECVVRLTDASDRIGLRLESYKGRVFVAKAYPGLAGKKAGMRNGRIILSVDGNVVTTPKQVVGYIMKAKAEKSQTVFRFQISSEVVPAEYLAELFGNKQGNTVSVTLKSHRQSLGMTVDLHKNKHIVVVGLVPNSPAALAGITNGAMISHINDTPLVIPADFIALINEAREAKKKILEFRIEGYLSQGQKSARDLEIAKAKQAIKQILIPSHGISSTGKKRWARALGSTRRTTTLPSRPASAYLLYVRDRRPEIKSANPSMDHLTLRKHCGEVCQKEFSELSELKRQEYEERAAELKAAYEKDLIAFMDSADGKAYAKAHGETSLLKKAKIGKFEAGKFLASVKRKRRKIKRSKKDPNMPQKPATAYMRFVKEHRMRILESHPETSFIQIAKRCGEEWGKIGELEQARYYESYAKDKAVYDEARKAYLKSRQHEDWQQKVREVDKLRKRKYVNGATLSSSLVQKNLGDGVIAKLIQRKRREENAKRDPNRPRKPKSAFLFFMNDVRGEIIKENLSIADTGKRCGEEWRKLEKTEKKKYFDMAAKANAEHAKKMKEYFESDLYKNWKAERRQMAIAKLQKGNKAATVKKSSFDEDPNLPKRPQTAYNAFAGKFRKRFRKRGLDVDPLKVEAELGKSWKILPDAEKQVYVKRADVEKMNYAAELEQYMMSSTRKKWETDVALLSDENPKLLPNAFEPVAFTVKLLAPGASMGCVLETFKATGSKWSWLCGVAIILVVRGSAADVAGLKPGWVITHVDSIPVKTPHEFTLALAGAESTKKQKINILVSPRKVPQRELTRMMAKSLKARGQLRNLYLPIAPHQSEKSDMPKTRKLAIHLSSATENLGLVLKDNLGSEGGAVVDKIYKKGLLGTSSLRLGDVILGLNGVTIKNAATAVDLVKILRRRCVLRLDFRLSTTQGIKKEK